MALPRSAGTHSRQAHADLPAGTFERELGRDGFYGPATHMLHAHPPTAWTAWDGPLRPRAFDCKALPEAATSPLDAAELLGNQHLRLRFWRTQGAGRDLVRNADGDELLFVHSGGGALYCDYGHLALREGDYVVVPRGTMWRVDAPDGMAALLVEATGDAFGIPERGLIGQHAIFDAATLDVPAIDDAFRAQQDERETRVTIRRRGLQSVVTFPFNPLDALGWHGTLVPLRLNWRDIRPLMSHRLHLPPSAHTTFAAERFVVCTFVPRPIESDPGALKLPFFHSNDDYDEVLFYHRGTFTSRDGIGAGMITFHPSGFTHGPHPKAWASAARDERRETDEVAVMIDARDALTLGADAQAVEWDGYVDSWKGWLESAGATPGVEELAARRARKGGT